MGRLKGKKKTSVRRENKRLPFLPLSRRSHSFQFTMIPSKRWPCTDDPVKISLEAVIDTLIKTCCNKHIIVVKIQALCWLVTWKDALRKYPGQLRVLWLLGHYVVCM